MSRFFDMIDKYKFGLIAALTTYIAIFMYLKMDSYTHYFPIKAFNEGPRIEMPKDEIELSPENIMLPSDFNGEVKSMSRDANDKREKSYENYNQNKTAAQIEADYKALEQQMYEDAGGDKTRDQIRKEMKEREKMNSAVKPLENKTSQTGGDKAYAGNVMVDWSLPERDAHQKNNWYVRNPGYNCGHGATGRVTVMIKVNQNGNVTGAEYDPTQSSKASGCMIEQALKYALMSRFSYSGSAEKIQMGRITYTFISQ